MMTPARTRRATLCIGLCVCLLPGCRQKGPTRGGGGDDAGPTEVAPATEKGSAETWDRSAFDHGLWGRVLGDHVDDEGLVDYAGIRRSDAFREYLYRLAQTDATGLRNDDERLAFWINAYNALTIKAVLDTLPQDQTAWPEYSIQDQRVGGRSIWKGISFKVGGRMLTLDEVEHSVLRKQEGLRDPRMHLALVCAARGCPALRNQAYTGEQVKRQLRSAVDRFLRDKTRCRIDAEAAVVHLSKVFEWYAEDFTDPSFSPHADSVVLFLAMSARNGDLARTLRGVDFEIQYLEYDWKLNVQR